MSTTRLSEITLRDPSTGIGSTTVGAGMQCQGKLWSNLRDVCSLLRIPYDEAIDDRDLLFQHVQFKTGQRVHTIGQEFDTLCVIYSGFLKTVSIDEFGNEQVQGFPMKGDILGVDSIYSKHFASEAVALSDCNMILIPFKKLAALAHKHLEFEHTLYSLMSREIVRKQSIVNILGASNAEARVARFLISLSDKFHEIGYSRSAFSLRMTRQEIGSYLGLSLETVSRTLSALNDIGIVSVDQRSIKIIEHDTLKNFRRIAPSRLRTRQRQIIPHQSSKWAELPSGAHLN